MASSKPSKFAEAEVGEPVVDFKALKGDEVELWSIRVPPGFDVSKLNGVTVNDDGAPIQGGSFVMSAAPAAECEAVVSAFPSSKKKRWLLAKPFAKQYVVHVLPPTDVAAASTEPLPLPPVPQHTTLRMRNPTLRELPLGPTATTAGAAGFKSRKRTADADAADGEHKKAKKSKKDKGA